MTTNDTFRRTLRVRLAGMALAGGLAVLATPALAAPAIIGNHVVAGDYDGYLHWFSLDDGHMSARVRVSRKPLRAQPVVADGLLLAQDTDGNLSAYRVGQ